MQTITCSSEIRIKKIYITETTRHRACKSYVENDNIFLYIQRQIGSVKHDFDIVKCLSVRAVSNLDALYDLLRARFHSRRFN